MSLLPDSTLIGVVGHCDSRTARLDDERHLILVIPGIGHHARGGLLNLLVARLVKGVGRDAVGIGANLELIRGVERGRGL